MKYRVCEYCGAALDFVERCDCQSEQARKEKRIEEYVNAYFKNDKSGQIALNLGGSHEKLSI